MRTVLTMAALAALQVGATAQVIITEQPAGDQDRPAVKVQVANEAGPNAGLFYKAFYLETGARKLDHAIEAYRAYLEAAPRGHFSPRSAYSLRQLLIRVDREDEAREIGEQYKDVIALRRRGRNAGGRNAGFGGRGDRNRNRDGADRRANYAKDLEKLTKNLDKTQKALEGALASNDQTKIQKLTKKMDKIAGQIKVMQRRMERGDNPRRRGEGQQGRRRGGMGNRTPLKDMSKEELDSMMERMDSMMERMGQFLDPDRADEIEEKFKSFKKLVKDGKLEEAQKMRNEMFQGFRRRR